MPLSRNVAVTAGKVAAWIVIAVVVVVLALILFIAVIDWNRARPWVDDKVSQAIGRPFAINGDLRVAWQRPVGEHGWRAWVPWPRFTANDIAIGNPPWAKAPQFATIERISFEVELLPLLAHTIAIPSIDLVNPSVDLERVKDGRDNWTFTLPQSKGPSRWTLRLADLGFAKGRVALSDEIKRVTLQIGIDTLGQPLPIGDVLKQQEQKSQGSAANVVGRRGAEALVKQTRTASAASGALAASGSGQASAPQAVSSPAANGQQSASSPVPASGAAGPGARPLAYGLGWTAQGSYRDTRIKGSGKLGNVLALRDASRPFPLQADVEIGDTRLALVGTLTDPMHLAALDLRLWLQGQSLDHLYPILGVTLPETPPYATDGHLSGRIRSEGSVFTYSGFTGRVGGSDLEGTLTYEARRPRPLLTGTTESRLLRFEDLAPIVGADTNANKRKRGEAARQPADRALPVEQFKTDRWKAIDADVKFTGHRIVKNPALPVTDLYTHVLLKDGSLKFEPLRFGVAGGKLDSTIDLDGSTAPLRSKVSMSARHLLLKQLFPTAKTMQSALGEVNGDAALTAVGNSPAALGATLNGEAKVLVTEGKLSHLLLEEAGLNVANIVYGKLFGDRDVNIHCAAADFTATQGVLDAKTFALDTDDAVVGMSGKIDLRDEAMDLTIHPHTKGFRVFSLRSPLYVKGTFKDPDVGVSKTAIALRAGAAIGLGLINPFAALIPLIAPSHTQSAPCDALIAQMRAAPQAPPPKAAAAGAR
jgi:uncharacterized protein involved in outer membrane biogenesis